MSKTCQFIARRNPHHDRLHSRRLRACWRHSRRLRACWRHSRQLSARWWHFSKLRSARLRTVASVFAALSLAFMLAGCSATEPIPPDASQSDRLQPEQLQSDRLQVVVSKFPEYDFLRQVGGDRLDITMLISPGSDAHSYEPSPKDIIAIQSCDLFVCGGGESDQWIERLLSSDPKQPRMTVTLMDCVETLDEVEIEAPGHNHTHLHIPGDSGHASPGASTPGASTPIASSPGAFTPTISNSNETVPGKTVPDDRDQLQGMKISANVPQDEHVWTSPRNAILIVEKLRDALSSLDPEFASQYEKNAADYVEKLRELDRQFTQGIDSCQRRTIVVGDRFPFLYLADAYGLSWYAAWPGCAAQTEVSAGTVAYLTDIIRDQQIPVVFYMELSNEKMADILCESTGAKKMLLHSCHTVSKEDFESGATYLSLMEQNLDHLLQALQ